LAAILLAISSSVVAVCFAAPAAYALGSLTDAFTGPAGTLPNPAVWTNDTGGEWGNGQELEYYTASPQNASLDGRGHLVITARNETFVAPDVTRQYTSARLQTWRKFEFTYGRIAARIKLPSGPGLWPAFWALGDGAYTAGDWPGSGEIDVMESLGDHPSTVYGTIHGPLAGSSDGYALQGVYRSRGSLAAGFHVYSAEWSPTGISFAVDGHTYRTVTPDDLPPGATWPFDHPFFLVLNLAIGGTWGGPPTPATFWPAHMIVDWVRVSGSTSAALRHRSGHSAAHTGSAAQRGARLTLLRHLPSA
jgi:beta-glucanase (GH16 family)